MQVQAEVFSVLRDAPEGDELQLLSKLHKVSYGVCRELCAAASRNEEVLGPGSHTCFCTFVADLQRHWCDART